MIEMYLWLPRFMYSVREPFTKNKENNTKIKKKNRKLKIYLSNGQFLFNMIWPMKSPRWKSADKVLHDKSFDIAKNSKYDGYQHGLASMVMQLHVHRQRP